MAFRGGILKVFLAGIALAALIPAGHGAFAAVCSTKAPAVTAGNFDVVFDTTDLAMKACVNGTWVVMSGGGGGATALSAMSDVQLTSPTNGQVLTYNGTKWVNGAGGGGGGITALTGEVTASGTGSVAATIATGAVTYAKIQNVANGKLLGRSTAGAGVVEELTVGSGLSLSGGTLSASGGASANGTAGYVQFSGGSGAFASSGTAAGQPLFWDTTNYRLGIGTSAPSDMLSVAKDVAYPGGNTSINLTNNNAAGFASILFNQAFAGTTGGTLQWNNTTGTKNLFLTTGSTDPLHLGTSNTVRATINGVGNFGVGNTNPTLAGLQVDKGVGSTIAMFGTGIPGLSIVANWPGIYFNSYHNGTNQKFMGTGYAGLLNFDPTTGDMYTATSTASGSANANVTQTATVWFKQSGKVGIGTNNPSTALEVNGIVTATNVNQAPIFSTRTQGTRPNISGSGWFYTGEYLTITVPAGVNRKYRISMRQMFVSNNGAPQYGIFTLSTSSSTAAGIPQGIGVPHGYSNTGWVTINSEGYVDLAPGTYTYYVLVNPNGAGPINIANAISDGDTYCTVIAWPL